MPLYDSLGTSQFARLPKMTSVPTTDDLRYLVSEAKKRLGKPVELPFEHPQNHQFFIIKLVMAVGNRVPPAWTLQRGDGAGAKVIWNRSGEDVMIIQNKIKIDAQYVHSDGEGTASSESAINTGGSMDQIVISGNLGAWGAAPEAPPDQQIPTQSMTAHDQFLSQGGLPTSDDPFGAAMQPPPPMGQGFGMSSLAQPPSFLDKPGQRAASQTAPDGAVEEIQVEEPLPATPVDYPKPQGFPLPPPIKLDLTLVNQVHAALSDPNTGLMTFPSYVFFLLREFVRYQKDQAPFSVVVFELALMIGPDVVALPPEAVVEVARRVRTVCSALDVITHLGGGEFSIVLASTDGAGAILFGDALRAAITAAPLVGDDPSNEMVLAAVGAASIPETCDHPEVLIAAARQAKELAKSSPEITVMFPVLL